LAHEKLVVRGLLVLDDDLAAGQITVEHGRISSVEPDTRAAEGPYIAPGFVDVHVHGWGGRDAMGDRPRADHRPAMYAHRA
jgi:N-acetylglucosamine-6-phosphate deacetylase